MANHKATKKDTRQANKRRERNRYHGKTTRNAMRDLVALTSEGEAKDKLKKVEAMLDKLAKRNIIHKNKAANLKSALAKKINTMGNVVEAPVKARKSAAKKAGTAAAAPATKKATAKKAAAPKVEATETPAAENE
jgi:small subunit ribosomal protein S20